MLFSTALLGFPVLACGFEGTDATSLLLNEGDVAAAPSLTLLMILFAALQRLVEWRMLDRDGARAAATTRLSAAAIASLSAILALDGVACCCRSHA